MTTQAILGQTGVPARLSTPVTRLQIANILCPVDFSVFSDRALRYAASLARHFRSRLFIQHTAEPANYQVLGGMETNTGAVNIESQLQTAREEVRRLLRSAEIDTSEATVLLNDGFASQRILEAVDRERIDLLVMGAHGHRGFNRLLLGSVTESVIHRAACPVLAVSQPRRKGDRLRTILLATDFSSNSDRALIYALKWGCEWGARVVLFHAVREASSEMLGLVDLFPEYNPSFERQIAGAWEQIRNLVPETANLWCDLNYEVRQGNPKEQMLRVAEEKNADLIITGARGAGESGMPWGSVSSAVVRDGRFPVLVVRELRVDRRVE